MLHLAWPWMALLLPLPWLMVRMRRAAGPNGAALYLPFAASVAAPTATATLPRGALALLTAVWALLVLAGMRPQWLGQPLPVATTGRQVMLAIDCSGSMASQDMAGGESRLQVVQEVAGQFIDQRRGDQIGLILFGTQPYLQAPLTTDIPTVHQFLDEAVVGVAGPQTAIGDAIGLAIKQLRQRESTGGASMRQSVLILLTDGGNDAGVMPPLQAARLAAQTGLRIFTIGVGAAEQQSLFGSFGNSDLDVDLLQKIATITGGEYFRATDAATLSAVYHKIDELEPVTGNERWLRPAAEWFTWPLALALLLSLPAAWLMAERI
jgi:Ca-activated chloride channel homolog